MKFVAMGHGNAIPSDSDVPEIYTSKKKALANLNAEIGVR